MTRGRIDCGGRGRERQDGIRSREHSRLGQADRVLGRRRAGAGQHGNVGLDRVPDGTDQRDALIRGERARLAGSSSYQDGAHAPVGEVGRERAGGRGVDRTGRIEDRDQRDANAAEDLSP